jgi:hypothetical protein
MSDLGSARYRLARWVLLGLASLVSCLALSAPARAADPSLRPVPITAAEGQLGALLAPVPALITGVGDAGGQIRVDNVSRLAEAYQISVQNYTLDAHASPIAAPPGFPYGSAAWYVFEDTEFVLPPGTSRNVRFRLDVPPDAIPGDHFAALTVLVRAADPSRHASGSGVRSQLVLQIRLQHRIAGAHPRAPRLVLEADAHGGSVDFTARVTNIGNTVLTYQVKPLPELLVTSTLPFWNTTQTLTVDGFYVPPQSERLVRVTWSDPPLIGAYRAVLTLPAVDGLTAVTMETTFVVVDWLRLGLIVGGVLVTAGLVMSARRRRWGETRGARQQMPRP